MTVKVFVSHSSKDEEIATTLIALIRASLNLKSSEILCTSVSGYKIMVGADIEATLKEHVMSAEACVGIITPISLDSAYVLFELGARWGSGLFIAPVLAAGATPTLLRAPLNQTHALSCDKRQEIQQLISNLGKQLQIGPEDPHVYENELAALLSANAKTQKEADNTVTSQTIREKQIEPAASAIISDEDVPSISITTSIETIEREASKFVKSELVETIITQRNETAGKIVLRSPILANYELTILEFSTKSVFQDFPLNLTEYLSGDSKVVEEVNNEAELVSMLRRTFESDGAKSKVTAILQRAKAKLGNAN